MLTSITEDILRYQETGCGLDQIVEKICLYVYRYPRRTMRWDEDDCSDFFCYFFPKIKNLVNRFKYTGKPFEAYLVVSLKYQFRSFLSWKKQKKLEQKLSGYEYFLASTMEDAAYAAEPLLPGYEPPGFNVTSGRGKRRFLFLVLKGYPFITSTMLEKIAVMTGYEAAWLLTRIEALRGCMEVHRQRLEKLGRKRNRYYFNIYKIHEELQLEVRHEKREELYKLLDFNKDRMRRTLGEINRVPKCPTHKEIALVLGIPKGSVDSGLFYLKNTLAGVF
ncbi:MAG: hypothetical protein E4H36_08045 [Spirochaetales bacterium]|nr:MAG: hypothetical protein E4H36_08045 [Spirochaetales bacterium]